MHLGNDTDDADLAAYHSIIDCLHTFVRNYLTDSHDKTNQDNEREQTRNDIVDLVESERMMC